MMDNNIKKHDSCVRVLEFLKLLFREDVDIKDLSYKITNVFQHIEATETFLKYISTLEISGLNIQKKGKKYSLKSSLTSLDLSEKETDLLVEIYKAFTSCCVEDLRQDLDSFIETVSKSLKDSSKNRLLNKINAEKPAVNDISLSNRAMDFQKYVNLGQKLKVLYKNNSYTVEPKKVEIENQKIYLIVYNNYTTENMKLLTDDIEKIEVLPLKNTKLNLTSTIVFEVYNDLVDNYRLRENERVQIFSDNHKAIINYGEDKKELINRLLKYGENCKIISPQPFKEEFLKELSLIEAKFQGVLK